MATLGCSWHVTCFSHQSYSRDAVAVFALSLRGVMRCVMEFRWPALIALWTMLVAPILASPPSARSVEASRKAVTSTSKAAEHVSTLNVRLSR